jgi:hypothetical protein
MTPFHVLLSAANCRLDLLQVLLDALPPNVLGWKDVNENTAIEYFCQQICVICLKTLGVYCKCSSSMDGGFYIEVERVGIVEVGHVEWGECDCG